MNETVKQKNIAEKQAETLTQPMLDEKISAQMVLEHPTYKQLEEKLTQTEQKAQENWDSLLRTKADFENLQRRTEREIANAHKYSIEKFAHEILSVVDSLERSLETKIESHEALKDFYAGVELTLKMLLDILQKFGITQINPKGEVFNHEKHTAITAKEDPTTNPNTILEVIQKGYWLKDRLLRPALVIVSKGMS